MSSKVASSYRSNTPNIHAEETKKDPDQLDSLDAFQSLEELHQSEEEKAQTGEADEKEERKDEEFDEEELDALVLGEEYYEQDFSEGEVERVREEELGGKSYSGAFMRQVSVLKNARVKKNDGEKEEFIRDADNGLSYTKMKKVVERAHPRILVDGKLEKYPICRAKTGWHLPSQKYRKSDLKEMGVGIWLYFKFLKYLIWMFTVATLFAIPSIVFFISGSDGEFKTNPSFETMLSLTTIGNLGTVTASCSSADNNTQTVSLFWTYGTLINVQEAGTIDSRNSNSNCKSNGAYLAVNSSWSYSASTLGATANSELDSYFLSNCQGKKIWDFDLSQITWPSSCSSSTKFYLKAACESEKVLGTDKETIGYIVVSFDIIICFFLWIALQVHGSYEDLEEKEIEGIVLDGEDFTIEVANIPPHKDYRVLKVQIWRHIEKVLEDSPNLAVLDEDDQNAHKIAQLNVALDKYLIMYYFKQRLNYEKQDRILALREGLLKIAKCTKEVKEKKKKEIQKKREKVKRKHGENEEKIKQLRSESDINAVKVFITMQSMEGKERVKKEFHHPRLRRCWGSKSQEAKKIQGKWLTITDAPKSSLILWENLSVSKTQRCVRFSLITALSLLIILISFVVMILMKSAQRTLNNNYNVSTWPSTTLTSIEALKDYNRASRDRTGFMHCYWLQEYNNKGVGVRNTLFSDGGKYCDAWYTEFALSTSLIYILSFVMANINVAVKVVLRIASKYERRHDKTGEVVSNTFKMFLAQIFNTAILLLFVNFKMGFMPSWFPLFAGDYDDFSSDWYNEVGTAIILTMFLSIFGPHLANSVFHLFFALKRLFDRGWRCNKRRTKKLFQIDYETLYIGPEYMMEYRYSQILSMFYIAVIFGAGMPILYFFLVLTFTLTYWVDKFTVLRIYRKPPRVGKSLIKVTREWLNLSIIIHFTISLWIYSNSAIFDTDSQNLFGWGSTSKEARERDQYSWLKINETLNQYHMFMYICAFGLFILCFIFKTVVFNFVIKLCLSIWSSNKNKVQVEGKDMKEKDEAYSNNFFVNLEKEQLERIIEKTQTEIEVYRDLITNPVNSDAYRDVKDDIEWYINRMERMINEMQEALKNNNDSRSLQAIDEEADENPDEVLPNLEALAKQRQKKLYVQDHTYDIREIRPYSDFLADEDLVKREDI